MLVDVLNDFRHEDGTTLAESVRDRLPVLLRLIEWARAEGLPVVYVNDALGQSRCCREHIVATANAGRLGVVMAGLAPHPDDVFIVKPFYSGFEQTGLESALRRLGVGTVVAAGAATERCVAQTITSARERGFDCIVVADACATVDRRLKAIALDYLENVAEATIVSSRRLCWQSPGAADEGRRAVAATA
jgi:nicotinamidase-related amidase